MVQKNLKVELKRQFDIVSQWLIKTRAVSASPVELQRAHLLALLLFVLFSLGVSIIAINFFLIENIQSFDQIPDHMDLVAFSLALGFMPGLFLMNRYGYTDLAAAGTVILAILGFVSSPFLTGADASIVAYNIIPILYTAIFFSRRAVMLVSAVILGALILIEQFFPFVDDDTFINMWFFLFLGSLLTIVFMWHWQRLTQLYNQNLHEANLRLKESELVLENRVEERTRDLQMAAEVAKQVASELDLDKLLPLLATRVKQDFNLYSVTIFLYDPKLKILRHRAANDNRSPYGAGQFEISRENLLITEAAQSLTPILENDVSRRTGYFNHPELSATAAELAIPMIVHQELIGVLDLQIDQKHWFTPDNLQTFISLTDQIAIAVHNANLYTKQLSVSEELLRLDRLKGQFFASVSHELRTPLNAILNLTEFVSLGILGPVTDEQQDALEKTLLSGQHLLSLINDVLEITRIEGGMMKLMIASDVDLLPEIREVFSTAKSLLKNKPVQFLTDLPEDLPLVRVDRRRIKQILLNLVSNACKFTEKGSITFLISTQKDHILFRVMDTGPGIALEDQERIFHPFQQTDKGMQYVSGVGLGLAISSRFAQAHGGEITVTSQPGKGSTFTFTLPIRAEILEDSTEIFLE